MKRSDICGKLPVLREEIGMVHKKMDVAEKAKNLRLLQILGRQSRKLAKAIFNLELKMGAYNPQNN